MRPYYPEKSEKKAKARLPLSAYLIYLLIASTIFTGISFSKFASSQTVNGDAKVAFVSMDAGVNDGQSDTLRIDTTTGTGADAVANYGFYIENRSSEVAMRYKIIVELPSALPTGMTLTVADGAGQACACTTSGNVYTFTGTSEFAAGVEARHAYTLTFTGDSSLIGAGAFENILVSVTAEQID